MKETIEQAQKMFINRLTIAVQNDIIGYFDNIKK